MEIQKLHQRIVISAATGLLAIGSIIAALSLLPLYNRLEQEQHRYLVTLTKTKAITIQNFIEQSEILAKRLSQSQVFNQLSTSAQTSSQQNDFFQNSILFLSSYLNDSLVGFTRFNQNQLPNIQVGIPLPINFQPIAAQSLQDAPVTEIIQINGESYLVVQVSAGIKSKLETQVFLFRLATLQKLLQLSSEVKESGQIILGKQVKNQIQPLLSSDAQGFQPFFLPPECLEASELLESQIPMQSCYYEDEQATYAYSFIPKPGWGVLFKADHDQVYAPIQQQITLTIIAIAGFILVGTGGVIVIMRPLTQTVQKEIDQRQQAEVQLQLEKSFSQSLFATNPAFFIIIDGSGKIQFANETMLQTIGYTLAEIKGKNYTQTLTPAEYHQFLFPGLNPLGEQQFQQARQTLPLLTRDQQLIWVQWQGKTSTNPQTGEVEMIFAAGIDVTERQRAEEQLRYNAYHDALTGLWNRTAFLERLDQAIARHKQYLSPQSHQELIKNSSTPFFAVLFLDLDGFKLVNDSLGHWIGDQLLIAIAHRLQSCLRPEDTFARFGGDEFTILLESRSTLDQAITVAQDIQTALKQPFELAHHTVFTETSIGIVSSTTTYEHPHELLRDADTAMYCAKARGKNSYVVFDQTMRNQAVRRLQLETDLRLAIERGEFEVYYQPLVRLATGETIGFEALIRWHHPTQGHISPSEFIPVAEETGAIAAIGAWVLRQACWQLQQWKDEYPGNSTLRLSVNLSSKQLTPELIPTIDQILTETGTEGWEIKLELTETALMQDPKAAIALLQQLKNRDIGLCVDDFGTGYCSLEYLHQFPVDILKIDRAFVHQMCPGNDQGQIVQAILALAHSLGIDAIAEGIETREQMYKLRLLRCKYGQGYYFAKPMTAQEVERLLADQKLRDLIYTSTGKPH